MAIFSRRKISSFTMGFTDDAARLLRRAGPPT